MTNQEREETQDDIHRCDFCRRPGAAFGSINYDGCLCETCETRCENGTSLEDLALAPV